MFGLDRTVLSVDREGGHLAMIFTLHPNPARALDEDAIIELDEAHFGIIDQFQARFAYGVPSLLHCRRLSVTGDFYFGSGLELIGDVELHPFHPDHANRR